MKLFITGATGVLGRRVVQGLTAGGHQVVGLSRSPQNAAWLNQHGVEPRVGDLFDPKLLVELTADCEGILHLATAIPTRSRTTARDWALNDRIRREGTENLVTAAQRNNHKFYLQESVTFVYGDRGGAWVDESTALPPQQVDILQSAADMEQIVRRAGDEGLPATILRFGTFYSHDSAHTQGMFQMVKKGFFPIIGNGSAYVNLINVDDAAAAIVKAVENHNACLNQTFNVCDDEPVMFQTYLSFVADMLGAKPPRRIPAWLARLLIGGSTVDFLLASARCRNDRFKTATGWQPQYATYREGLQAVVEHWLNSSDKR